MVRDQLGPRDGGSGSTPGQSRRGNFQRSLVASEPGDSAPGSGPYLGGPSGLAFSLARLGLGRVRGMPFFVATKRDAPMSIVWASLGPQPAGKAAAIANRPTATTRVGRDMAPCFPVMLCARCREARERLESMLFLKQMVRNGG